MTNAIFHAKSYTQPKYNLLYESSEGYSKLILDLFNSSPKANVEDLKKRVKLYVGMFDLDPNKVQDIILHLLEEDLSRSIVLIPLLKIFPNQFLAPILGMRLKYYVRNSLNFFIFNLISFFGKFEKKYKIGNLCTLVAKLIGEGLMEVQKIYPYFLPKEEEIVCNLELERKKKEELSRPVLSLPDSGEAEKKKEDNSEEWKKTCQTFGVLIALFQEANFPEAKKLLIHCRVKNLDPLSYGPIVSAYCSELHHMVNPLYSKVHQQYKVEYNNEQPKESPFFRPKIQVLDDIVGTLLPELEVLGIYLHQDAVLFTKLCRIISHWIEERKEVLDKNTIQNILSAILLPALCLFDSMPGLCYELWQILSKIPYDQRYLIYSRWKNCYGDHPLLVSRKTKVTLETDRILKRISKTNVKEMSLKLAKLCHSNPLVSVQLLISRVISYRNMIEPCVDALKFLSKLSFDTLPFFILNELANDKERIKDGTSVAPWLENLADFCGYVCKKYNVDIQSLFDYVTHCLLANKVS